MRAFFVGPGVCCLGYGVAVLINPRRDIPAIDPAGRDIDTGHRIAR